MLWHQIPPITIRDRIFVKISHPVRGAGCQLLQLTHPARTTPGSRYLLQLLHSLFGQPLEHKATIAASAMPAIGWDDDVTQARQTSGYGQLIYPSNDAAGQRLAPRNRRCRRIYGIVQLVATHASSYQRNDSDHLSGSLGAPPHSDSRSSSSSNVFPIFFTATELIKK
jgi:hypothetical protein